MAVRKKMISFFNLLFTMVFLFSIFFASFANAAPQEVGVRDKGTDGYVGLTQYVQQVKDNVFKVHLSFETFALAPTVDCVIAIDASENMHVRKSIDTDTGASVSYFDAAVDAAYRTAEIWLQSKSNPLEGQSSQLARVWIIFYNGHAYDTLGAVLNTGTKNSNQVAYINDLVHSTPTLKANYFGKEPASGYRSFGQLKADLESVKSQVKGNLSPIVTEKGIFNPQDTAVKAVNQRYTAVGLAAAYDIFADYSHDDSTVPRSHKTETNRKILYFLSNGPDYERDDYTTATNSQIPQEGSMRMEALFIAKALKMQRYSYTSPQEKSLQLAAEQIAVANGNSYLYGVKQYPALGAVPSTTSSFSPLSLDTHRVRVSIPTAIQQTRFVNSNAIPASVQYTAPGALTSSVVGSGVLDSGSLTSINHWASASDIPVPLNENTDPFQVVNGLLQTSYGQTSVNVNTLATSFNRNNSGLNQMGHVTNSFEGGTGLGGSVNSSGIVAGPGQTTASQEYGRGRFEYQMFADTAPFTEIGTGYPRNSTSPPNFSSTNYYLSALNTDVDGTHATSTSSSLFRVHHKTIFSSPQDNASSGNNRRPLDGYNYAFIPTSSNAPTMGTHVFTYADPLADEGPGTTLPLRDTYLRIANKATASTAVRSGGMNVEIWTIGLFAGEKNAATGGPVDLGTPNIGRRLYSMGSGYGSLDATPNDKRWEQGTTGPSSSSPTTADDETTVYHTDFTGYTYGHHVRPVHDYLNANDGNPTTNGWVVYTEVRNTNAGSGGFTTASWPSYTDHSWTVSLASTGFSEADDGAHKQGVNKEGYFVSATGIRNPGAPQQYNQDMYKEVFEIKDNKETTQFRAGRDTVSRDINTSWCTYWERYYWYGTSWWGSFLTWAISGYLPSDFRYSLAGYQNIHDLTAPVPAPAFASDGGPTPHVTNNPLSLSVAAPGGQAFNWWSPTVTPLTKDMLGREDAAFSFIRPNYGTAPASTDTPRLLHMSPSLADPYRAPSPIEFPDLHVTGGATQVSDKYLSLGNGGNDTPAEWFNWVEWLEETSADGDSTQNDQAIGKITGQYGVTHDRFNKWPKYTSIAKSLADIDSIPRDQKTLENGVNEQERRELEQHLRAIAGVQTAEKKEGAGFDPDKAWQNNMTYVWSQQTYLTTARKASMSSIQNIFLEAKEHPTDTTNGGLGTNGYLFNHTANKYSTKNDNYTDSTTFVWQRLTTRYLDATFTFKFPWVRIGGSGNPTQNIAGTPVQEGLHSMNRDFQNYYEYIGFNYQLSGYQTALDQILATLRYPNNPLKGNQYSQYDKDDFNPIVKMIRKTSEFQKKESAFDVDADTNAPFNRITRVFEDLTYDFFKVSYDGSQSVTELSEYFALYKMAGEPLFNLRVDAEKYPQRIGRETDVSYDTPNHKVIWDLSKGVYAGARYNLVFFVTMEKETDTSVHYPIVSFLNFDFRSMTRTSTYGNNNVFSTTKRYPESNIQGIGGVGVQLASFSANVMNAYKPEEKGSTGSGGMGVFPGPNTPMDAAQLQAVMPIYTPSVTMAPKPKKLLDEKVDEGIEASSVLAKSSSAMPIVVLGTAIVTAIGIGFVVKRKH